MTKKESFDAAKASLQRTLDEIRGPLWDTSPEAASIRARDQVYEEFRPLFSSEAISGLRKEDFDRFLSFKNNHHWRGLQRLGSAMTSDMDRLRAGLAILLDEGRPIRERLNTLRPAGGNSYVPKMGRAFITPILHVAYPDRYGVWNRPVAEGLRKLGIHPKAQGRGLGDRYVPANELLLELSEALGIDLWTLDTLWWRVIANVEGARASGGSPGDRESQVDAARHRVQELVPDLATQERLLRCFSETIRLAHEINPASWALTLPEGDESGVRLNVGQYWSLGILANGIAVTYVSGELDAATRSRLRSLHPSRFARYRLSWVQIPASEFASWWPELAEAHRASVRIAAESAKRTIHSRYHAPGAVDFIAAESGQSLPAPSYDAPDSVREGTARGYSGTGQGGLETSAPAFTADTFRILTELRGDPTRAFVQAHAEELERAVEQPFKALLHRVVERLPAEVRAPLETEKNLFSRFNKNDYGRGGAWHYLWGALYPKGGRRITGIQLFVYVVHDRFEYGLAFGQDAGEMTDRFVSACRQNATRLADLMRPRLDGLGFRFGSRGDTALPTKGEADAGGVPMERWLENPRAHPLEIRNTLSAREAVGTSLEALAERVAEGFVALFPLALLAIAPDPLPAAVAFASEELLDEELNEFHPISRVAEESGLDESVLEQWVQAIHRKGQAILYGPPGTGKTFLARLLAKHLAGGSNGVVELVQFHPAYAYEDFIQGIRPKTGRGDAATFDVVSGRFLEFCSKAAQTDGTSVMIIDEINRANLSRVMGELMYLLEYRSEQIPLAGGGRLMIPSNVRLIGTMNTADRSIALVDHALRRRFAFLKLAPNYSVLQKFHSSEPELVGRLVDLLKDVNRSISDPHYEVGITFFLVDRLRDHLPQIWRMEIEPYLEEYFFDRSSAATEFGWERVRQRLEI